MTRAHRERLFAGFVAPAAAAVAGDDRAAGEYYAPCSAGPFSALFWAFLVVSSILMFPIALRRLGGDGALRPAPAVLHQFTCFWGSLYTWMNPAWPVELIGREKIRATSPT